MCTQAALTPLLPPVLEGARDQGTDARLDPDLQIERLGEEPAGCPTSRVSLASRPRGWGCHGARRLTQIGQWPGG